MGLASISALALHNLGGVLHWLGRLDEARSVEQQAVLCFERAKDPRLEGACRVYLSRIVLAAGDAVGAEAEARRAIDACAVPSVRAGALAVLSQALVRQGRLAEALAAAGEAAQTLASLGSVEDFETLIGLAHVEALDASGDRDAARAAIADPRRRLLARAARMGDKARARFLEAVPDNARCLALAKAWGVPEEEPLTGCS
jgi:ATP/maltotriose-dependent transcriptional regulator MalT